MKKSTHKSSSLSTTEQLNTGLKHLHAVAARREKLDGRLFPAGTKKSHVRRVPGDPFSIYYR